MSDDLPERMVLHEKLQKLAIEADQNVLSLSDGMQRLAIGGSHYGAPLLVLSLINAIPVPSFGLKSLLGVIVSLLGLQMLTGKQSVWLPRWFATLHLRPKLTHQVANMGGRLLPKLEGFVKPRYHWMKHHFYAFWLGVTIFLLGLVMILPVPGTKILTSPVLLALSLGLIEQDGLLTLLAALTSLVIVVLYIEAFYLLYLWLAS